jgi:hypothetical protein
MFSWLAIQILVASETTGVAAGGDVSLFDDKCFEHSVNRFGADPLY